jgi:hypothetical protein
MRIGLDKSAEEYFESRPGVTRYLARYRRLAERDGYEITVVHACRPEEIEKTLPDVGAITTVAQRDRFKSGELETLATGMLPGSVRAVVDAGRAHVTLVRFSGRPAAFSLALLGGGTVQTHLSGYDTDLRRYAPNYLSDAETLRWAVENGYREVDLGIGAGEYKRRWTDEEYQTKRVIAAPNQLRLDIARAGLALRGQLLARRQRLVALASRRDNLGRAE